MATITLNQAALVAERYSPIKEIRIRLRRNICVKGVCFFEKYNPKTSGIIKAMVEPYIV
jgi:hypothetical protein